MTVTGDSDGLLGDKLRARIVEEIGSGGRVSFARFMEMALYEPDLGYYVSGKEKWGKEGDYITTLDVSSSFARMIARQILEMWQQLGSPEGFHIIEVGAGRGWLTAEVLRALAEYDAPMAKGLNVHLVEKNNGFCEEWARWSDDGLVFKSLEWHRDVTEIEGPLKGCIFSNELFDAMPFHRVVMRRGALKEIYTCIDDDGAFKDIEGDLTSTALAEYFDELGMEIGEGQSTEVNLNIAPWVEAASELLEEGFLITVDYGMPAWRLYGRANSGTLMCHFRHTLNDEPYLNLGRQDITAHVDFTTLKNIGNKSGFTTIGYTSQRCFMMGLGVLEELAAVGEDRGGSEAEAILHNQGIKELIMPGGIGDTMKVMVQQKGTTHGALKGFSFKDMTKTL
jgi:SAM-dependent MidA family methyltransferase